MAGGESYGGITVPKGDPGALEASAGRLVSTAGMLQSLSGHLNGVLGALSWFGPASAQHSLLTGTQNLMATTSANALIQQASVINGYAEVLQAAQRQSKRAIERAKDADDRIKQAEDDIRQAVDDQISAQARIVAAQAAQSRLFTSAVDLLAGDAAAAAAIDLAAAEEADARRDLHAAEERERQARKRLKEAEEDRREAQKDGDDAEEAVGIARVGLIAAAQGAGLLPTVPGGPANPAFAAAAGITLPKPPEPKDEGNWLERRLDDVGNAASWTWDQAQQVPGGAWEGTKGIYEGGKFLVELNPTNPMNWRDPGAMIDRYEQLGQAGKFAWENPGEFGKAMINYEDLAAGRYGEWAGNLLPDAVAAVATGGAGAAVTRSTRLVKATDKLADASSAYNRASDIKQSLPTQRWRDQKTVATHAGDDGAVSISGDAYDMQRKAMEKMGLDPDLLVETPAKDMKSGMKAAADHDMPSHPWDKDHFDGYYYSTHAENKLLLPNPDKPVGVSQAPCERSCDPGISSLADNLNQDILVHSDEGPVVYRGKDGKPIPINSPEDFPGVNSKWPGLLWGAGGGTAAAGMGAAGGP